MPVFRFLTERLSRILRPNGIAAVCTLKTDEAVKALYVTTHPFFHTTTEVEAATQLLEHIDPCFLAERAAANRQVYLDGATIIRSRHTPKSVRELKWEHLWNHADLDDLQAEPSAANSHYKPLDEDYRVEQTTRA